MFAFQTDQWAGNHPAYDPTGLEIDGQPVYRARQYKSGISAKGAGYVKQATPPNKARAMRACVATAEDWRWVKRVMRERARHDRTREGEIAPIAREKKGPQFPARAFLGIPDPVL